MLTTTFKAFWIEEAYARASIHDFNSACETFFIR